MQKKIDKIKMMKDKDERNEKEGRDFFLKMRPPEYFFRFWSLSLPQKGPIFMANS